MEEHDQYESLGLDESLEDERDLDQIMADRRAAEVELEARDAATTAPPTLSHRKLPHLLHDQGPPLPSYFLINRLPLKHSCECHIISYNYHPLLLSQLAISN